jgi:hypothetical protein
VKPSFSDIPQMMYPPEPFEKAEMVRGNVLCERMAGGLDFIELRVDPNGPHERHDLGKALFGHRFVFAHKSHASLQPGENCVHLFKHLSTTYSSEQVLE